jgi:serine/threonine protein phosphatase 1
LTHRLRTERCRCNFVPTCTTAPIANFADLRHIKRMFAWLRRTPAPPAPAIPSGQRIYAVGDIHGRLDLLDALLEQIRLDSTAAATASEIILLGDLIDRGPDSAGVLRRAMQPPAWASVRALMGNHEAALLATLDGDERMARSWIRMGGRATLASWGMDAMALDELDAQGVIAAARALVPPDARAWIARMRRAHTVGGYHFVHAGVRPGIPIDRQAEQDSLWIRGEFLQSTRAHGAMIIHGHAISSTVEERPNRIGIDTGAYRTGRLTALALEGDRRWLLSTADSADGLPSPTPPATVGA